MNRSYTQYDQFDVRRYVSPEEFGEIVNYVNSKYNNKGWQTYAGWGIPQNSRLWANFVKNDEIIVKASVLSVGAPKPQRSTTGYSSYGGSIPKIGHGLSIDEADLLTMQELSAQGSARLSDMMMDRLVYTLDKLIGGIHNKLNTFVYQALSTGFIAEAVTDNVDGTPLDIDYKFKKNHFATVGTGWDKAEATPIQDLLDAQKAAENDNMSFDHWEMTKTKYDQFINHQNTTKVVAGRMNVYNPTSYTVTETEILRVIHDLGVLPIRVVDEKSAHEVDGVAQLSPSAFNEDNCVLCQLGQIFEMKCANSVYRQRVAAGPVASTAMYTFVEDRTAILDMWQESPIKNIIETELWALPVIKNPNNVFVLKTKTE